MKLKTKVLSLFIAAALAFTTLSSFTGCIFSGGNDTSVSTPSVTAKATDEAVTLTWTIKGSKKPESIEVNQGTDIKSLTKIADLAGTETSYKVEHLTNGTTYYFSVTAIYEDGTQKNSATVKAKPYNASQLASLSSVEFAENLVIGWNLGNTLDATATWTKDTETAWGMPKTTQAMIKAVHAAGFETIRIPVSWHNHVSGSDYTIDSTWMARVKTIVDWAYNDGMYVIINIHHDNLSATGDGENMANAAGFCLSKDAAIQTKSKKYIEKVWTQIATTFANYDNHLIFEVLNEPRDIGGQYEWWMPDVATAKKYTDIITAYEQVGLDTIRSISGNENRFVMVPGYAASGTDQNMLKAYTMPKDSADDKLILSTHAYSPNDLALSSDMTKTTFDTAAKNSLDSIFNYLKTTYTDKGIGVVMGEGGCTDKNNTSERIKWAKYYFGKAKAAHIPVVLWDNMVVYPEGKNGAERHGHFDRNKLKWYFPDIMTAMMNAAGAQAAPEDSNGDNNDEPETPKNPSSVITIFDAEIYSGSEEIVTINGKKFLKLTINGYNTSFNITPVDCSGATNFTAECFAAEDTSAYQVVIGIKDSSWKNISGPTMNPLTKTVTTISAGVASGEKASTAPTAAIIQPMAQNTTDWGPSEGIVFYISKITAE